MLSCVRKIKKYYKPELYFKHNEQEEEHSGLQKKPLQNR